MTGLCSVLHFSRPSKIQCSGQKYSVVAKNRITLFQKSNSAPKNQHMIALTEVQSTTKKSGVLSEEKEREKTNDGVTKMSMQEMDFCLTK